MSIPTAHDNQNNNRRILVATTGMDQNNWRHHLSDHGHDIVLLDELDLENLDAATAATIDYAIVWKHPQGLLRRLPNLKTVFSAGAGVDSLLEDPDLYDSHANTPIVRVIAPSLTAHMVDYVLWRVLDHHRQGRAYREAQAEAKWNHLRQPNTDRVSIGIMGLGELGGSAARALNALGFDVAGWSRRSRNAADGLEGITCFSGQDDLTPFLNRTDILVALLPLTPDTEGLIDYALLSKLRQDGALGGPSLINAGRGRLQKEVDILRALDEGILKEASLDVFEREPLDVTSLLWSHPRVFVTPHAAADSDPSQLGSLILEQIDALENGRPLQGLVDRQTGY